MSGLAAGWALDTLWWTGLLGAFVLLLRRPVAQLCGAQAVYALWALPLLRLLLPPVVLPAGLAPSAGGAGEAGFAAPAILMPLWLAGACGFLLWRLAGYRRMHRELLSDARPVGEAGRVRLVETPAVSAPVAFGVLDKVVALPPAFMALPDRAARDLALAHELAHHRGHDLLAIMAAQALLALHWFNPLAWLAWRAFRRDQETACDARVMAGADAARRADYARVIAGFAMAGRHPLAAPMACPVACPVLGESSIVSRVRGLARGEIPALHRRAGLALVICGAMALPLSATVRYAAAEALPVAALPPVQVAAASVPPVAALAEPVAALAPEPPAPPVTAPAPIAAPATAEPAAPSPPIGVPAAPPVALRQVALVSWRYEIRLTLPGLEGTTMRRTEVIVLMPAEPEPTPAALVSVPGTIKPPANPPTV